METIKGSVEGVIYANEENGYAVVEFSDGSDLFTATGALSQLSEGELVELTGSWTSHPTYGDQFKAEYVKVLAPENAEGLLRYLASGSIKGIGERTALRIVEAFGMDALDVLANEPERVAALPGVGVKRAELFREQVLEKRHIEDTMIFLQSLRLPQGLIGRILRQYEEQAPEVLKNDPYRLVREIRGVGFKTADGIARTMGLPQDSPRRIREGILYTLMEAASQEGHVCVPRGSLVPYVEKLLEVDEEKIAAELEAMIRRRGVVLRELSGEEFCYAPLMYSAEVEVAQRLIWMVRAEVPEIAPDPEEIIDMAASLSSLELSEEQRDCVTAALTHGVTVVTGGPGTGKTTTISCIIQALEQCGCTVELAAPTGRAAKRMQESTGHEARTIHRLLEYGFDAEEDEEAGEGAFRKNEDDPLEADCVVLDEMSMVDLLLMRSFLRAIRPGTRLVLVGDADQLPSVGAGNVLRDILSSGIVPVKKLTEIFRQARESHIVINAHRINRGEMPVLRGCKDFFFSPKSTAEAVFTTVRDMMGERIPKYLSCDPMNDIQVMAPMKKGEVGVYRMNERLQEAFNPPSPRKGEFRHGDMVFRDGDKVMQIKNNYQLEWTRTEADGTESEGKGVFNGDVGRIIRVEAAAREMTVRFDDGREVRYSANMLEDLTLSYCISIHKSQGSEFPVVILPLLSGFARLMTRNLLYTAVTRAKKMVVIVGQERTVAQMVENNTIVRRYSGLADALVILGKLKEET